MEHTMLPSHVFLRTQFLPLSLLECIEGGDQGADLGKVASRSSPCRLFPNSRGTWDKATSDGFSQGQWRKSQWSNQEGEEPNY